MDSLRKKLKKLGLGMTGSSEKVFVGPARRLGTGEPKVRFMRIVVLCSNWI